MSEKDRNSIWRVPEDNELEAREALKRGRGSRKTLGIQTCTVLSLRNRRPVVTDLGQPPSKSSSPRTTKWQCKFGSRLMRISLLTSLKSTKIDVLRQTLQAICGTYSSSTSIPGPKCNYWSWYICIRNRCLYGWHDSY